MCTMYSVQDKAERGAYYMPVKVVRSAFLSFQHSQSFPPRSFAGLTHALTRAKAS